MNMNDLVIPYDRNPFWDFVFVRYIEVKLYGQVLEKFDLGLSQWTQLWIGSHAEMQSNAETSLTLQIFQVQPNWSTSWQGPRNRSPEPFKVMYFYKFLYLYKTL